MKKISICILLVLALGCNQNQESTKIDVVLMEPEVLQLEEEIHKPTVRIQVKDTFMILIRGNEPIVQIYGTNSFQLIGEFGNFGDGLEEFKEKPTLVKGTHFDIGNQVEFTLFDFSRSSICRVNIQALLKGEEYLFWERINFPAEWSFLNDIFAVSEKYAFVMGEAFSYASNAARFGILNRENNQPYKVPIPANPPVPINSNILTETFYSHVAFNKEKNLLAAISWYYPQIDFYSTEGELLFSSLFDNPEKNSDVYVEGINSATRTNALSRYEGSVFDYDYTEDYIIVRTNVEPSNISFNADKTELLYRVFDWEGEQMAVFSLEANNNTTFTYDKHNHRFLFYDSTDDGQNFKTYDLPPFE